MYKKETPVGGGGGGGGRGQGLQLQPHPLRGACLRKAQWSWILRSPHVVHRESVRITFTAVLPNLPKVLSYHICSSHGTRYN